MAFVLEVDVYKRQMVIALNMMDEVRANGGTIKIDKLQEELGVPVVPISASKNEGSDELIDTAVRTARNRQYPRRQDFCSGAVHRAIHSIAHLVEDHAERIQTPPRFAATKLVEGDEPIDVYKRQKITSEESRDHGIASPNRVDDLPFWGKTLVDRSAFIH